MITVLRQYFSYDVIDSRTYDVSLEITMKVTEKQPFFLLPVDDYRADLRINDSEGKSMIILPDAEFEARFGKPMSEITQLFLEKIKQKSGKNTQRLTKNYRVIAIMLNQRELDEYYEKVTIRWIKRTEISGYGRISKYAEIKIFLPRFGFTQSKTSAIYLSIKADNKYKILEDPKIRNWTKNPLPEYKTILDDVRHKVYRFSESNEPHLIQITVKIGIPNTVRRWAMLGLFAAVTIPSSLLFLTLFTHKIPTFAFEALAGVIALLVGEKILIFRDIPLMKRWSTVNLGLVIWCVSILVFLMSVSVINNSLINNPVITNSTHS